MSYLGGPDYTYSYRCTYSDWPGATQCGQQPAWHIRVRSLQWGCHVTLLACDEHAPVARTAGVFEQEHQYEAICGMPGVLWDAVANRCCLDDSGVSLMESAVRVPELV